MKNYLKIYLLIVIIISVVILFIFFNVEKQLFPQKKIELKSSIIEGDNVSINDESVTKYPFFFFRGNNKIIVKNYSIIFLKDVGIISARKDSLFVIKKNGKIEFYKGEMESEKYGVNGLKLDVLTCKALISGKFLIKSQEVRKQEQIYTIKAQKGFLECKSKEKLQFASRKMFTITQNGEVLIKTIPLPPNPLKPKNLEKIGLERGNNVNFLWSKVKEADRYILEISYNKAFFNSNIYTIKENRYSINFVDFKNSPVYWRVYSVDQEGNVSLPSEHKKFYLEDLLQVMRLWNNPPKLTIEEPLIPQGNLVIIKGETERGVKLIINGSEVNVDNSGKFMHVLSFDKIGEHSIIIKAINLSGREKVIVRKVFIYEK